MEETFFEYLERTALVDTALLWLALLAPPLLPALAWMLRATPLVRDHRHRWLMALMAAPLLAVLWRVYNAVTDHYGLDSIFGFGVNAVIFLVSAVALAFVADLLEGLLGPVGAQPAEEPAAPGAPDAAPPAPEAAAAPADEAGA